jgi:hypothetical protein
MKLQEIFESKVPSEAELIKLSDEFKKEFDGPKGKKEWGDTLTICATEHGNCAMVSDTFIDWLKERGIDSKFIGGEKAVNRKWAESAKRAGEGDGHQAVRVGSTVIDWTAKQFDKSFPIPRIYDVGTFDEEWDIVND